LQYGTFTWNLSDLPFTLVLLDIDQRHLLRLGHGEEELNTDQNFGKFGRVNSFLERRLYLLQEVDRLSKSLGIEGEHGATCETAGYFYSIHVLPTWNSYISAAKEAQTSEALKNNFPFSVFFSNAPQPLFTEEMSFDDALDVVEGCFRHLEKMFTELEDIRPFELLRTGTDRANYLLTKEAKIIAMTCTHAALKVMYLQTDISYSISSHTHHFNAATRTCWT
jgi:intron-binding protein aquarius